MKKIFFAPVFVFIFFCILSCERDESLDPRPVIVAGQYVKLDITKKRLNSDDIANASFGGRLTTPGGNVAKYNLYVRKSDIFQIGTEFKLIKTVTSFPYDLNITPADLATALNVPVSSLVYGDIFRFYGESFDASGNRCDFYSLSTTVQSTTSMKQGYRFITDMTNDAGMDVLELSAYDNYITQ